MSKQHNFHTTIAPESIQEIIKEPNLISEFIIWQKNELIKFKNTAKEKEVNAFVKHYANNIKKKLERDGLFGEFFERLKFYSRMETTKLISLSLRIKKELPAMKSEIKKMEKKEKEFGGVKQFYDKRLRKNLSRKQWWKIRNYIFEHYKMRCRHMCTYCSLIYDSFFATEYACKYLCAMGCYRFAKKIAESKVVGHSDVWKTLKDLSGIKKESICGYCFISESCKFDAFLHLSNLYAAIIKLRMLCDYSETFEYASAKQNIHSILSNNVIPTVLEIHNFMKFVTKKSGIMWSPMSDKDLGIPSLAKSK
jgi:hypothetical protein